MLKVGGSLLELPDLAIRLDTLRRCRPSFSPLLIAGGGAAADAVRSWGRTFSLSDADCHELAIESMNLTASLMTRILPHSRLVRSLPEADRCWANGEWPVLQLAEVIRRRPNVEILSRDDETMVAFHDLPASWDVTSDSLSAWISQSWHAEALWLLKSADLMPNCSFSTASEQGLVDAFFPQLAPEVVRIFWCNLRAEPMRLQIWTGRE